MRRVALVVAVLLSLAAACREADSVVLVNVDFDAGAPSVNSLRVSVSGIAGHDVRLFPAHPTSDAVRFPASLVLVLPRARSGRLDIFIEGLDSSSAVVASGSGQTTVVVGGQANASIGLAPIGAGAGKDGSASDAAVPPAPDASIPGAPDTRGFDANLPMPDASADFGAVDIVPAGLSLGSTCVSGSQCSSTHCVDGVCCDDACTGLCKACNIVPSLGHCSFIPAGADSRGACPQDPQETCGRDGTCDGAAACRQWIDGTSCGAAGCIRGTASTARTCNGAGVCRAATTTACKPYSCRGLVCAVQCAGNGDCDPSAFCNAGNCQAKLGWGAACSSADECASHFCTRSVTGTGMICAQSVAECPASCPDTCRCTATACSC